MAYSTRALTEHREGRGVSPRGLPRGGPAASRGRSDRGGRTHARRGEAARRAARRRSVQGQCGRRGRDPVRAAGPADGDAEPAGLQLSLGHQPAVPRHALRRRPPVPVRRCRPHRADRVARVGGNRDAGGIHAAALHRRRPRHEHDGPHPRDGRGRRGRRAGDRQRAGRRSSMRSSPGTGWRTSARNGSPSSHAPRRLPGPSGWRKRGRSSTRA